MLIVPAFHNCGHTGVFHGIPRSIGPNERCLVRRCIARLIEVGLGSLSSASAPQLHAFLPNVRAATLHSTSHANNTSMKKKKRENMSRVFHSGIKWCRQWRLAGPDGVRLSWKESLTWGSLLRTCWLKAQKTSCCLQSELVSLSNEIETLRFSCQCTSLSTRNFISRN